MPSLWQMRLRSPGIPKMADRTFSDILEEITACEVAIGTDGDADGSKATRLRALKQEVYDHPSAAAGRDLPPVVGVLGR